MQAAESPAHAFGRIQHRRRFSDGEIEAGDRLNEMPCFVVHHDRAALATVAIQMVGDDKKSVERIDRDARTAVDLVGVRGTRMLRVGDPALAFQIVEPDLRTSGGNAITACRCFGRRF